MKYLAILSILLGVVLYGCGAPRLPVPNRPGIVQVDENGNPVAVTPELGRDAAKAALAANAEWLQYIGAFFVVIGILVLIASFLPWTGGLIPKGAAIAGVGGGLLSWALQYVILVYGVFIIEAGFWLFVLCFLAAVVLGAIFVVYPLVMAWKNRQIGKDAKVLLAKPDDKRAGVALMAVAKGLDSDERKELLKTVGG